MQNLKNQLGETVQQVIDGKFDALEAYAELNDLKRYLDTCMDRIKADAVAEAMKHGTKPFKYKDFEIAVNEGRRTYDYKNINPWVTMMQNLKAVEETAKYAADMYSRGKTLVDDSGEVVQPCLVKYSEPFLTIKIAK